jgi:hypothetical protein
MVVWFFIFLQWSVVFIDLLSVEPSMGPWDETHLMWSMTFSNVLLGHAWGCKPVIPASWEVEVEGWQVRTNSGKVSDTQCQKQKQKLQSKRAKCLLACAKPWIQSAVAPPPSPTCYWIVFASILLSFCCHCCFGSTGVSTQGFTLAKQVLYHLNHVPLLLLFR